MTAENDNNLDIMHVLRTQTAAMRDLTNAIEIMSEELRLLREASQNDDGATLIADKLEALATAVKEQPAKLLEATQIIADTAARKTLTDMPC